MRSGLTIMTTMALLALAGCGGNDSTTTTEGGDVTALPTAETPAPIVYASLTGDAKAGERSFLQCKICHAVEADQNRIGPSLHAIIGRKAASVAGFNYSPAMRNSGITWTEDELFTFIGDTRGTLPGTKMAFAGMPNAQTRADVIAYLKQASK